jgi:hypothetical protein
MGLPLLGVKNLGVMIGVLVVFEEVLKTQYKVYRCSVLESLEVCGFIVGFW